MVILNTLIPFDFQIPDTIKTYWILSVPDYVANIILFIPIGFLFKLSHKKSKGPFCLLPFAYGAFLGFVIESAQAFIPAHFTQITDVIANAIGAWLGAGLFMLLQRQLSKESTVKFSVLELPSMQLVYQSLCANEGETLTP